MASKPLQRPRQSEAQGRVEQVAKIAIRHVEGNASPAEFSLQTGAHTPRFRVVYVSASYLNL